MGSFSSGVVVLGADGRRVHMQFQIPQMPINTMHVMGADSVLIGVDGAGVYLVGAIDGRLIRHYSDSDGTDDELSGNTITDVHVDRHNGIWITTSHNGLNYISPAGKPMEVLKSKRGNPDSLISDYVNVIYEDSGGDIWYGTDKGVTRYSPSQRRWWNYLGPDIHRLGVVLSLHLRRRSEYLRQDIGYCRPAAGADARQCGRYRHAICVHRLRYARRRHMDRRYQRFAYTL